MALPAKYKRNFGYKFSHFGSDTAGHDLKAFGETTGKYMMWDASANTFYVVGTTSETGNKTIIGTLTVGVDDTGHDVTFFGATTGKKFFWDESADTAFLTCTVDIDGTVTVGVDDTGYDVKFFGATSGKYFLWDESADAAIVSGILQLGTTTTAALAFGGGTSASKLTTATADKNFGGMYTESTATGGDSRGLYWRHYLGGTIASTGYGDAVRAFATVTGTGYSYASGLHSTMQINQNATVTGSGAGLRATLAAEAQSRTLVGALTALQVDGDIGANNTVPARCSLIRLSKSGTIDIPYFLDISDDQCLKGDGTLAASASDALKVIMPNGDVKYIPLFAVS